MSDPADSAHAGNPDDPYDPDGVRDSRWWQRPEFTGALVVGILALAISLARTLHEPGRPTDFDQWYHAARAMWRGGNPFDAVGPTSEFRWGWSLNYPLPAVLLVVPLTLLSAPVARVCFSTIGGAILGYGLGKDQFRRLALVLSAAFLIAVSRNQWSPFMTAAYFVPFAAVFLAAKPNMAVPFVVGIPAWRQFRWIAAVGLPVLVASVIIRPSWPGEWLGVLQRMEYVVSPVMRPWGFLYALALLKWRRPEARVFLALVCVPQTPSLYDLLPLFVVTRTMREVSILALLTHVLFLTIVALGPFDTFDHYAYQLGNLSTFIIYLPVMVILLWRPNVFHDAPRTDEAAEWKGFKVLFESLSRADALLLLSNIAAAALLIWVTLATRR